MTAKEYLEQYGVAVVKLKHRKEELVECMAALESVRVSFEERVQNGVVDGICTGITELVSIEMEIRDDIEKLLDFKHKIIGEINLIENSVYSDILYDRYIKRMSLWDIAEKRHYSYRHLCRMHGAALVKFSQKIDLS